MSKITISKEVLAMLEAAAASNKWVYYGGMAYNTHIVRSLTDNAPCPHQYDSVIEIYIDNDRMPSAPRDTIRICRWTGECDDLRGENGDTNEYLRKVFHEFKHAHIEESQTLINEEQRKQMLEAAKPLIKWLNENCHPHCEAIVDSIAVRLVERVAINGTEEFLRD